MNEEALLQRGQEAALRILRGSGQWEDLAQPRQGAGDWPGCRDAPQRRRQTFWTALSRAIRCVVAGIWPRRHRCRGTHASDAMHERARRHRRVASRAAGRPARQAQSSARRAALLARRGSGGRQAAPGCGRTSGRLVDGSAGKLCRGAATSRRGSPQSIPAARCCIGNGAAQDCASVSPSKVKLDLTPIQAWTGCSKAGCALPLVCRAKIVRYDVPLGTRRERPCQKLRACSKNLPDNKRQLGTALDAARRNGMQQDGTSAAPRSGGGWQELQMS